MTIFNAISLLGGLALFLYGMRLMGDGLKKNSSAALQKVLSKVTNNPFNGFLLGLVITAVIQSSTATIVLTAGLVAASVMTFRQSIGIVFGANVGTTVTGQIIRLLDLNTSGGASFLNLFKPDTLAPIAAMVGIVIIMFLRFRNSDTIGEIAMGFGILFTGLINMTAAVAPLSSSASFVSLFTRFSGHPVLGFLSGLLVATIVQSSSASVGMLQTLSTTGVLTFASVYPILIGIYVGDALTTAIVCCIGTRADAKRTGLVTLLFSVFSIAFLMLGVTVFRYVGWIGGLWGTAMSSGGIANTNTVFKLASALACVPASNLFFRLATQMVKDDAQTENIIFEAAAQRLDEKLFISPKVALKSASDVICVMHRLSATNTDRALSLFNRFDPALDQQVHEDEECIDRLADAVDNYLIRFSTHVNTEMESDILNYYLQCFSEFERIGDHADNLAENAESLFRMDNHLSDDARREFSVLSDALREILEHTGDCFRSLDAEAAARIEPLEEVIDDLVAEIKNRHIRRLRKGQCTSDMGIIFVDALTNIERISDQCSNVAVSTLGIRNSSIVQNRHEYIHELHEGRNEFFNREYARQKNVYLSRLD